MKFLPTMAMLTIVAGLAGSAAAQMPFPFGGPPQPALRLQARARVVPVQRGGRPTGTPLVLQRLVNDR